MALRMKGDVLRAAMAKLRGAMTEGLDDNAIAERLGVAWEDVQELKQKFIEHESEILRTRSTEHTYVRYVIEQRQCIHDLDRVIGDYEKQKNVSGVVGAIRAKADILERVLKTGQELGLVERLSKGEGYAAGEAIKQMTNIQFQQFIVATISDLDELRLRFGDKPITQLPTGPLHLPATTAKRPVKGHARTAVHGGRRVVKGRKSS